MNAPKSSLLSQMHRNPTPHTWMHRNHHPSRQCTGILPFTHECTEIVTPQINAPKYYSTNSWGTTSEILPLTHECTEIIIPPVNAPESYPSHMNASTLSLLRSRHRNPTPHTWMHKNQDLSSKCTGILPLTHECTEMVTSQLNAPKSYPSHMKAPKSSFLR